MASKLRNSSRNSWRKAAAERDFLKRPGQRYQAVEHLKGRAGIDLRVRECEIALGALG